MGPVCLAPDAFGWLCCALLSGVSMTVCSCELSGSCVGGVVVSLAAFERVMRVFSGLPERDSGVWAAERGFGIYFCLE